MIKTNYLFLIVSINDVLLWDESGQHALSHPDLSELISNLDLQIDLKRLHNIYFQETLVGRGDVFLYEAVEGARNVIAFDLYKEPLDQMDLIRISIRCDSQALDNVRKYARQFYDSASCQLCMEEANISAKVIETLDRSSYPKLYQQSNYRQRLRVFTQSIPDSD